jgi:hypothetical protein
MALMGIPPSDARIRLMYLFPKSAEPDWISLNGRSVTSPAQIGRAVALAVFFAIVLIWILASGSARAESARISIASAFGETQRFAATGFCSIARP